MFLHLNYLIKKHVLNMQSKQSMGSCCHSTSHTKTSAAKQLHPMRPQSERGVSSTPGGVNKDTLKDMSKN